MLRPAAGAAAAVLVLAACGTGGGTDTAAPEPTTGVEDTGPPPAGADPGTPTPTEAPDQEATGAAATAGVPADLAWGVEPRDGTWRVGDAGEVDVEVRDGGLVLLDVRTEPGWEPVVDEESPDEIEVDFRQGPAEWEIEVEYEDGELEVEIDWDLDPAEPGRYSVGEAGAVEIALEDGVLRLVGVEESPGWTSRVDEESPDEIEVDFVQGAAGYEFDAELDDGVLEVEIDFEVEGRFPR